MTKGEIMVALGIGGLVFTFIIFIISSIVLHRREKKALADFERNELALIRERNADSMVETESLEKGTTETELMKTTVLKNNLKETDILK